MQLYVFSKEKDPDYPYGEAKVVTLKELRCHLEDYNGKKVRAEGVIAAEFGHSVYIEDYDTETDSYFGISVYYGFNATPALLEIFKIGNRVSVVGVVSYFEGNKSYQISGVTRNAFKPNAETNTNLVSAGNTPGFKEVTASDIVSGTFSVRFVTEKEDEDGNIIPEIEDVELDYGEAIMSTSVSVKNLEITKTPYTTNNGGDSDGAMSITCKAPDGTIITVRTEVLKNADGSLVTAAAYPKGTKINVKGIIEKFNDQYQVKVYHKDLIEIVG